MSDDWIVLIPEEAGVVPDARLQQLALERFKQLVPEAYEVRIQVTEKMRFVDPGANWGRITCPTCGSEVTMEWWMARMDEDYKGGFPLRAYAMPCCGGKQRLHDLRYEWPVGFARFSLEALNPNVGRLPDAMHRELEGILGVQLRVIYKHY